AAERCLAIIFNLGMRDVKMYLINMLRTGTTQFVRRAVARALYWKGKIIDKDVEEALAAVLRSSDEMDNMAQNYLMRESYHERTRASSSQVGLGDITGSSQ
ncbi:unnamed protein product, partial [marine sediment metagenome]